MREVGELLDFYSDRTTLGDPDGSQVVFIPGKVIDNVPFIWTKPADEILDKINRKHKHVSTTRY